MRLFKVQFGKPKLDVTFHMKSGERINVIADDIKITFAGNDLQSYKLLGVRDGGLFYLCISDISAITYVNI